MLQHHGVSSIDHAAHLETHGAGGAIRSRARLIMTHSCILGSHSDADGGGIYVGDQSLRLVNCTLSLNSTDGSGGAIYLVPGTRAVIEHCTIYGNSCSSGLEVAGIDLTSADLEIYSTIIAGNNDPSGASNFGFTNPGDATTQVDSRGYNLSDALPLALDHPTDIKNTDPQLFGLTHTDGWAAVRLSQPGSPVRDAGDPEPSLLPFLSARGGLRVAGGRMDIGATEHGAAAADSDGDEIPDHWEYLYGLDPDEWLDALADFDLDGDNNLTEFNHGTDPRTPEPDTPETPLEILALARDATSGELEITFASDPGARYTLFWSADLMNWFPAGVIDGTPLVNETLFRIGTDRDQLFVRVIRDPG